MATPTHLGRNIRSIRVLQGMKQELFARKMGISQQRVSRLEQQRLITRENLQAAAKALNVSVADIETFDERSFVNHKPPKSKSPEETSIRAVTEHYSAELAKRDKKIQELETELNAVKMQYAGITRKT